MALPLPPTMDSVPAACPCVHQPPTRTKGPPLLKKQREAVYGVDKPLPVLRGNGLHAEEEDLTELSGDEGQLHLTSTAASTTQGEKMSRLSNEASRVRAHIVSTALHPENSFQRFKSSFMQSNASEALKARYAKLMNVPYHDVINAADVVAKGIPNPSSTPVKGQPHARLVRTSWG